MSGQPKEPRTGTKAGNGTKPVMPDRGEAEQFFTALLARAKNIPRRFMFRTFKPGDHSTHSSAVQWNGDVGAVVNTAMACAKAGAEEPWGGHTVVTAMPGALFTPQGRSGKADIAAMLGLVIDCDTHPRETATKAMQLLGKPSIVVRSGGRWRNGAGEPEDKLHLYFLFDQPLQDKGQIVQASAAHRRLLTTSGSADKSATEVHPYRFAGCVWRKEENGSPRRRLVQIAKINTSVITLDQLLKTAAVVPPQDTSWWSDGAAGGNSADGTRPTFHDAISDEELIARIVAGEQLHESLTQLAWRRVTHTVAPREAAGLITAELCQVMERSTRKQSDPDVWKSRHDDIGRLVDDAVRKQLAQRTAIGADPLTIPLPPQAKFPLEVLPAGFRAGVEAVSRVVQIDASAVVTAALTAAATAVAKLRPGVTIDGRLHPLVLMAEIIAKSGERKSTLLTTVFWGVRVVEAELAVEFAKQQRHYEEAMAVFERERRSILSRRGAAGRRQRQAEATAGQSVATADLNGEDEDTGAGLVAAMVPVDHRIGDLLSLDKPEPPPRPVILTNDCTVEGARDLLATGYGLVGVVADEGSAVVAGHSLGSKEKRLYAAAWFSSRWDGTADTVVRAGRDIRVDAPRVQLCVGLQPKVSDRFVGDDMLIDQGLLSRLLLVWPASQLGSRVVATPPLEDLDAVARFSETIIDCLRDALGIGMGLFEPQDAPLTLSAEAWAAWRASAQEVEDNLGENGRLESIAGWGAKAADQALRIAGVLTLFEDAGATEVSEAMMTAGVAIARWFTNELLRINRRDPPPPQFERADKVLRWLRRRYPNKSDTFTARDISRSYVAKGLTTRTAGDAVLDTLFTAGHVEPVDAPQSNVAGRPPARRWRLTGATADGG